MDASLLDFDVDLPELDFRLWRPADSHRFVWKKTCRDIALQRQNIHNDLRIRKMLPAKKRLDK